jgi:type IV pilus assembly protein PilA
MTASALRPQLKTALMLQLGKTSNKKKNLLQQGFTLVELMIVIVIVGILSAVALPNFLNQTSKAKATECTTKFGGMLSQIAAEAVGDPAAATTLASTLVTEGNTASALCTFAITAPTAPATTFTGTVTGDGDIAGKYAAKGCVNYANMKRDIKTASGSSGITAASPADASCT